MTLATRDPVPQSTTAQLSAERALFAQLAAQLASACGYPISIISDPVAALSYVTIGLPTGPVTVGMPSADVRLPAYSGPEPRARQTVRQRIQSLAAFLDASS